jgi:hypothetical protein
VDQLSLAWSGWVIIQCYTHIADRCTTSTSDTCILYNTSLSLPIPGIVTSVPERCITLHKPCICLYQEAAGRRQEGIGWHGNTASIILYISIMELVDAVQDNVAVNRLRATLLATPCLDV